MQHHYHTSACGTGALREVTRRFAMLSLVTLVMISCKKEAIPPGTTSLTVINAVTGSNTLVTNFSSEGPVLYANQWKLFYKKYNDNNNLFSSYSGSQRLRLFEYPDTTVKDEPVFDLHLELPVGSISTLFLTGTLNAPDTLFTRDNVPFFPGSDSAMAIRFVNLSPGSQPVSVNIKDQANGSEVAGLSFKDITSFLKYTISTSLDEYVFEFRDSVSGNLIASYTTTGSNLSGATPYNPNRWIYRSFTLALAGEPGGTGTNAQSVFVIDHY